MSSTYQNIQSTGKLQIPEHWQRFQTIDMHTGGEPLRVILSGYPTFSGKDILTIRRELQEDWDHFRTALMFEPRGHADMYGVLPVPPQRGDSDFGVIFMHNEGYSTMCGHATIAIAKLAVELGWVAKQEPETILKIDAPCGQLTASVHVKAGEVTGVSFLNVPSFVVALDEEVEVPGLGNVIYDLAYGGAFYAYVDARPLGLGLKPENYQELISKGMAIKRAVMQQKTNVRHPFEEDLSFLYGTIFIGDSELEGSDSRNVCIFAEGEVDRSSTGSGVSGRAAIHYQRGELHPHHKMTIESIVGSTMKVSVHQTLDYGGFPAIVPMVEGNAHITGSHEFFLDPQDPFSKGFILR